MQNGTEKTNYDKPNTDIEMGNEMVERTEEIGYLPIDTRIKIDKIKPISIDEFGKTEYMVKMPVPVINWEIDLTFYEKGLLFLRKTSDTGAILIKLIKFLIMVWIPLNYIKTFINERRKR